MRSCFLNPVETEQPHRIAVCSRFLLPFEGPAMAKGEQP